MRKKFEFGKIDFYGRGRKINAVTLEMELKEKEQNKPCFSVCGNVWNNRKTDTVCGGQCLDDIKPFFENDKKFMEIYRLWKLYHLNDYNTGTIEQEKALKDYDKEHGTQLACAGNYTQACEYLKSINLYEVEIDGKPYKYGHGWLYRPIPKEDLNKIIKLMGE